MKTKVHAQRKFAQGAPVPPSTLPVINPQPERKNDASNVQQGRYLFRHKTSARKLLDMVSFEGVHKHNPIVLLERLQEHPIIQVVDETNDGIESPKPVDNNVSISLLNAPISRRMATLRNIAGLNSLSLRSRTIVNKKPRKTITKRKPIKRYIQKRHADKINPKPGLRRKTTMKLRSTKRKSIDTDFSVDDERPLMFFTKRVARPKRKCMKTKLQKPSVNKDKGVTKDAQINDIYYGTKGITNWISDIDMSSTVSNFNNEVENRNLETSNPPVDIEATCARHSNITSTSPSTDIRQLDNNQQVAESEKIIYAAKNCRQCRVVIENCKNYYNNNSNSPQVTVVEVVDPEATQVSAATTTTDANKDPQPVQNETVAQNQTVTGNNNSSQNDAIAGPSSDPDRIYDYNEETPNDTERPQAYRRVHEMRTNKERPHNKTNKDKSDNRTNKSNDALKNTDQAKVVEAKIFYPTEDEFKDPVSYFEKIMPIAAKYGICKVVAPKGFKPSCAITDTVRFKATNQYISRLCNRWGPVTRELCAMRAFLAGQNVPFSHAPILEGLEINLPKLLHFVKRQGGLKNTFQSRLYIDPARWISLAAELNYTRLSNLEKKLDLIYVKYILPYDALTQSARQEHLERMDRKWLKRNEKLMKRAQKPLHRQKKLLDESDSSEDDDNDEDQFETAALDDAEDCIVPGRYMNIGNFKKIAETATTVFFSSKPSTEDVESKYWRIVLLGDEHVCVNAGAIDTGTEGYGFTIKKNDPYTKHPWNLKMFCENKRNVLRSLGRVLGVTIPTLHVGMVYTTSCWHRDPHGLPWIEYMHSGPEKIWYGIPDAESNRFRKAVENICPTACQNKSIWLPSDIAMIPPNLLLERGVSMSRITQKPGEYVIVFPKAYSCSICTGFTVSESVYFATNSWVKTVNHVFQELRMSCEPTMFALEQLLIKVARDPNASLNMLQLVHGSFSAILSEELENRRQLELYGLKPCDPRHGERDNLSGRWNVIDDECEICRSTLYLSRVKGVFNKHFSICLRHAIQVLEKKSDRNGRRDPETYQLQYLFTNAELEEVMTIVISRLTKATETNRND